MNAWGRERCDVFERRTLEALRALHPEAHDVHCRGYAHKPVVVFQRPLYQRPPTPEEVAGFEKRRQMVEKLGGVMKAKDAQEEVAWTSPYTEDDVQAMRVALLKALPEFRICEHWNGVGCRTCSFSVEWALVTV